MTSYYVFEEYRTISDLATGHQWQGWTKIVPGPSFGTNAEAEARRAELISASDAEYEESTIRVSERHST